jgi:cytochrome c-type biogenesis protein CcmE
VDLTPRTGPGGPDSAVASAPRRRAPSSKRRKIGVSVVLAVLLAAMAIILFEGLSNATMYFYNADEAVAKKTSLEDKRFRLQGQVVPGTVRDTGETVDFDVTFNGVTVAVQNQGSPPELFQEGIPVVLEGKWQGDVFASDRILVKHTSEYKAANPGRVPANAP